MNNSKNFKTKNIYILLILVVSFYSCRKDNGTSAFRYYEVGFKGNAADWRDSSFIVATSNPALITQIQAELDLSVNQRKIVRGDLIKGNGGYNKNASHLFKWRFKENSWELIQLSVEIYDGRPYSDVDNNIDYWMNSMKRFAPWGSYIKREILKP